MLRTQTWGAIAGGANGSTSRIRRRSARKRLRLIAVPLITIATTITVGTSQSHQAASPNPNAERSAARSQRTGHIRGTVVDDSAAPLARAEVRLGLGTALQGARPATITDEYGRFEVYGVPEGNYGIWASKRGHVTLRAGQRRPGDTVPLINVEAGRTTNVEIRLQRGGVVTGVIADEYGEPVQGVVVSLARLPSLSEERVRTDPSARTDDRGVYRIAGVAPGRYLVRAGAGVPLPRRSASFSTAVGYADTYAPGVASSEMAQSVHVLGGEELGVSFSLQSLPLIRVTGTVTDERGQAVGGALVRLVKEGAEGQRAQLTRTSSRGTFEFVTPSHLAGWQVRALAREVAHDPRARILAGHTQVSAPGDGQVVANVQMTPSTGLRGRVEMEGADPSRFRIFASAIAPEDAGLGATSAAIAEDGSFELGTVVGDVRVGVDGGPTRPAFVRRVTANGIDVTETGIRAGGATGGIIVAVEVHPATFVGVVASEWEPQGRLGTSALLLLFPKAESRRRSGVVGTIASARADDDGRFTISCRATGAHWLVALSSDVGLADVTLPDLSLLTHAATEVDCDARGVVPVSVRLARD